MGSETGLRFEALGALRVCADTEIELTRPAPRRVLSIMLLESGRSIPVPRLIDRMWGDSAPGDPRNTLQAHMAGLRRQLGDVIELTPDGYRLEVADHWFDVDEFTLLADRVEASVPHRLPEEIAERSPRWRGRRGGCGGGIRFPTSSTTTTPGGPWRRWARSGSAPRPVGWMRCSRVAGWRKSFPNWNGW